jgi:hypothetical protein
MALPVETDVTCDQLQISVVKVRLYDQENENLDDGS